MVEIVPAILPATFEDMEAHLSRIAGTVHAAQVDVVDGIFAPNKTWPYTINPQPTTDGIQLPFADEFEFEIDLMVQKSEDAAEAWRAAGAKRIIIHVHANGAREALMALRFEKEEHKKPEGIEVGIAIPSSSSVAILAEFENLYDYVQVMGIERVGFQGQPFDPRAVELVRQLRAQYPALAIQVDGGVGAENARMLAEAGANRLVVGSAIWESGNPAEEIETLRRLVN